MADKQAILGSGARFTGKITNAKSIEINGFVEADLATEKVTIGSTGKFSGAVKSDAVKAWIKSFATATVDIGSCSLVDN